MERSGEPAPNRSPSILVIDDEDYVADMIATILRLEHYAVYVAYNGRAGLELARQHPLDLVIADMMLPYLSGIELIGLLQENPDLRHLPVILMSAGARPRQEWAHIPFLVKPFIIEELLDLIAAIAGSGQPG